MSCGIRRCQGERHRRYLSSQGPAGSGDQWIEIPRPRRRKRTARVSNFQSRSSRLPPGSSLLHSAQRYSDTERRTTCINQQPRRRVKQRWVRGGTPHAFRNQHLDPDFRSAIGEIAQIQPSRHQYPLAALIAKSRRHGQGVERAGPRFITVAMPAAAPVVPLATGLLLTRLLINPMMLCFAFSACTGPCSDFANSAGRSLTAACCKLPGIFSKMGPANNCPEQALSL